jgi:hypothetical protein
MSKNSSSDVKLLKLTNLLQLLALIREDSNNFSHHLFRLGYNYAISLITSQTLQSRDPELLFKTCLGIAKETRYAHLNLRNNSLNRQEDIDPMVSLKRMGLSESLARDISLRKDVLYVRPDLDVYNYIKTHCKPDLKELLVDPVSISNKVTVDLLHQTLNDTINRIEVRSNCEDG